MTVNANAYVVVDATEILVGEGGSGVLEISGAEAFDVTAVYIGPDGPGLFTIAGPDATITTDIFIVAFENDGWARIEGGARITVDGLVFVATDNGTEGVLEVVGAGSTLTTTSDLYIGGSGSDGTLEISDGASCVVSDIAIVGESGAGHLEITGGGLLSAGRVLVASSALATGTLRVAQDANGRGVLEAGFVQRRFGAGTVELDGGLLRATMSGTEFFSNFESLTLGAGGVFFDTNGFDTASSVDFAGAAGFTKLGAGRFTLGGANTYSGDTAIEAGVLRLSGGAAVADVSSVSIAAGATLDLDGSSETVGGLSGAGDVTLGGGLLTVNQGADAAFAGAISGSGGLTKGGAGALTLSGTNTYGGATTVEAGTLRLQGGDAIADSGSVVVDGGVLALDASETVGRLSGSGGSVDLGGATLTVNQDLAGAYAGGIIGSGGLVKSGAGALTLSGVSTYAGPTTVASGLLVVTGSLTSAVTVAAGAALGGTGTVGALNVDGVLSAGGSPGVLNSGSLAFGTTGSLAVELGGTASGQYDQLRTTGAVTLDGTLNVALYGGFTLTSSATFVIIDNDGTDAVAGAFDGLAEGAVLTVGGFELTISYVGGTGNDVTLSYVAPGGGGDGGQPRAPTPTAGADLLLLSFQSDSVHAGGGDDTVMSAGGDDFIHGNTGDDSVSGGDGMDTVHGGQGDDLVYGAAGEDVLFGDGGSNTLRGGDDDDVLVGFDLFDDLHGGLGDDVLRGGGGGDWVVGGQGDDVLLGDDGDDVVLGNLGADTCEGGVGHDVIRGGQGGDLIRGGDGDDWLSGDRGDDTLTGGAGADTFHGFGEAGLDVVADFDAAEGDRIQLLPGTEYTLAQTGADVTIHLTGGARLLLQNVELTALPEGWIV